VTRTDPTAERPDPHPGPQSDHSSGEGADPRAFVEFMVRCDVLRFGDFVGKSGRAMPYFVNAGRYRTGRQIAELGRYYADAVAHSFGDEVDVLFGPAYKGIPLAVTTAIALAERHGKDVGFCFDRKEEKDHGEGGSLVGHPLADGDRVVIVEDVTTAGTSVRATVPLLRAAADVEVIGLVVGVDRRERGGTQGISALDELGAELGLRTVSLVTIDDIVGHLTATEVDGQQVLGPDDLERIAAYRARYGV
jgi:orotate phosphoribosyltransferase